MTKLLPPSSYRGIDGEDIMTLADWQLRGQQQALAMLHAGTVELSSPDSDGDPTWGLYNGDYPDSWHEECNRRLAEDEYYEASVDQQMRELYNLCECPTVTV